MNTKPVPAIVMLSAGFATSVVGIVKHYSFGTYVKTLFLVLVIFYIIGCIAKVVLDKCFRVMQDPLEEYENLEIDDDLMDELAMSGDEFLDDYLDH